MSIKHIILCIEFVFLAVQIIMVRAAYKSPLKYGKTAEIVNILALIVILLRNIAIIVLNIMGRGGTNVQNNEPK